MKSQNKSQSLEMVTDQQSQVNYAVDLLKKYHSCCTAVFATYAPKFGITEVLAAKLTQGMPGIGGSGNVCGAVSGAALVISLVTTDEEKFDDWESRQETCEMIREFIDKFEGIYQSTQCRDILGHDINSREKFIAASEKGHFTLCPKVVESAVNILDSLINNWQDQTR